MGGFNHLTSGLEFIFKLRGGVLEAIRASHDSSSANSNLDMDVPAVIGHNPRARPRTREARKCSYDGIYNLSLDDR